MNRLRKTVLAAAALAATAGSLLRAAPAALSPTGASKLWLEGDSTLHAFTITATKLELEMTLDRDEGESFAAAAKAGKPSKLIVTVPVASMKSEHSGLDKNMRKAMKADQYPDIVFALDKYEAVAAEAGSQIAASGTLMIAGVSKPVVLRAAVKEKEGRLIVEGEQPVLMTDYGIKPPKMMLGAVKTEDKVTVKYRLELASGPAQPARRSGTDPVKPGERGR